MSIKAEDIQDWDVLVEEGLSGTVPHTILVVHIQPTSSLSGTHKMWWLSLKGYKAWSVKGPWICGPILHSWTRKESP